MNVYLNISIISKPASEYVPLSLIKVDEVAHEKLKSEAMESGKSFMTPQDTTEYDAAVKAVEGQQVLRIVVFEGDSRNEYQSQPLAPSEEAGYISSALSYYVMKRFA